MEISAVAAYMFNAWIFFFSYIVTHSHRDLLHTQYIKLELDNLNQLHFIYELFSLKISALRLILFFLLENTL